MTSEFLDGFAKHAQERGFSNEEILELVKKSFFEDTDASLANKMQNLDSQYQQEYSQRPSDLLNAQGSILGGMGGAATHMLLKPKGGLVGTGLSGLAGALLGHETANTLQEGVHGQKLRKLEEARRAIEARRQSLMMGGQ